MKRRLENSSEDMSATPLRKKRRLTTTSSGLTDVDGDHVMTDAEMNESSHEAQGTQVDEKESSPENREEKEIVDETKNEHNGDDEVSSSSSSDDEDEDENAYPNIEGRVTSDQLQEIRNLDKSKDQARIQALLSSMESDRNRLIAEILMFGTVIASEDPSEQSQDRVLTAGRVDQRRSRALGKFGNRRNVRMMVRSGYQKDSLAIYKVFDGQREMQIEVPVDDRRLTGKITDVPLPGKWYVIKPDGKTTFAGGLCKWIGAFQASIVAVFGLMEKTKKLEPGDIPEDARGMAFGHLNPYVIKLNEDHSIFHKFVPTPSQLARAL